MTAPRGLDVFRYHEISESTHRILNPLAPAHLETLAEICGVGEGTRVLDLACGKAELLCQFAARHQASGVGIDIHEPMLAVGRARSDELGVDGRVLLVEGDASRPADVGDDYDVVACIGATWIGGGLLGTLEIMSGYASRDAWLLVGEVYWAQPPSDALRTEMAADSAEGYVDLAGTLDRLDGAGYELEEMLLASLEDWDRHAASQWRNVSDWLRAHPDDPLAGDVRAWRDRSRRSYLELERGVLGWGVLALRARTGA